MADVIPIKAVFDGTTPIALGEFETGDTIPVAYLGGVPSHNHDGVYEPADATILKQSSIDDTPVDGATDAPISSNWAHGHAAATQAHGITAFGASLVDDADAAAARATLGALASGLSAYFAKANPNAVAWSVTGANALQTAMALHVEVNGVVHIIAASTSITVPASPVAGTDYAIWVKTDGSLEATSNHISPPAANARRIGGYHYAPGGNAATQAGGNSTPAINPYSCWDLKWRPACPDPRGMTLVANNFWADIYLLNTDPDTNGTSGYNLTIADGSSPPKIPAAFGGDGTTTYGTLTWWSAGECLAAFGKRAPDYAEFAALAYGVTEATSRGTDPVTTGLDAARTSRWGVMQATGSLFVWGRVFGGPYGAASWSANTEGRGSTYNLPRAAIFGGYWGDGSFAGSRCSYWDYPLSGSNYLIGARGTASHQVLI